MSIGLYDFDFMAYTHIPPNLDLMKIAAYYKKHKKIVVLLPELDLHRHEKIYVVKDYDDGIFDKKILAPNVEYRGHAFSKEKYVPLPLDIELTRPDKNLYQKIRRMAGEKRADQKFFDVIRRAEHLRLSLDGKTIWKDYRRAHNVTYSTRTIIFHDYNLNQIEDAYYVVKDIYDIINQKGVFGGIGTKFPIQVSTEEEFKKWTSFRTTQHLFSIQYNTLFDNEFLNEILQNKNLKEKIIYDVTAFSSDEDDFVNNYLTKIFEQALLSRTFRRPFLLIYRNDFFTDKRWERVIEMINYYTHSFGKVEEGDSKYVYSLYKHITIKRIAFPNIKRQFSIEELRDLFQLVREKNYETFKMFYESSRVKVQGGKIVDD